MRNSQTMSDNHVDVSPDALLSYETQKRMLDILFGTILGILALPILLVSSLWIKAVSKGPVIYVQKRVGRGGYEFPIYKLRTMKVGAEGSLDTAIRQDPRFFLGSGVLRMTHVDELPQLWNVLKGDMSLVGPRPRPMIIDEAWRAVVPDYYKRRCVRPGITGPAQICGRSETDEEKRHVSALEQKYIEQWSITEDLKIMFFTVPHMLLGKSV